MTTAEKNGNFACEEEMLISRMLITNFVAQSISFPPTLKLVLQAKEGILKMFNSLYVSVGTRKGKPERKTSKDTD